MRNPPHDAPRSLTRPRLASNAERAVAPFSYEPRSLRTFTPTQAVLARSAGVYHWTPEGRRLYDFTSGVLVANLGHNPTRWMERFSQYMGWPTATPRTGRTPARTGYFPAVPLTAYNAVTPVEVGSEPTAGRDASQAAGRRTAANR